MTPTFSLIVVTIAGRRPALAKCLRSIDDQVCRDFEAIVVDQASDPVTRALVTVHPWARYLATTPAGASTSRNVGLQQARGRIVVFPDDDATLDPSLLQRAEALLRDAGSLGLLSGCAIDPSTGRRIFRFPARAAPLTVWNALRRHSESTIMLRMDELRARSARFDPQLGVGAGTPFGSSEATDLVLRLLVDGVRGRYDPSLVWYHANTELVRLPLQKALSYSAGAGACFRKLRARLGWWPLGALWWWTLARAVGGVVIDTVRGRRASARLRMLALRSRIRGWREYGRWLADGRTVQDEHWRTAGRT